MLRTMMTSTIHRAAVTQADVVFVDAGNRILATGFDPAETFGDATLARGDAVAR